MKKGKEGKFQWDADHKKSVKIEKGRKTPMRG